LNDSTAGKATVVRLALVGKARALLDMGLVADADTVASAANVPTSFAYSILHDLNTTRQQNGVYNGIRKFERYGVANREGGVGIPWRDTTMLDPRTPFTRSGDPTVRGTNVGFDNVTAQYDQLRYVDEKASIPLATGLEARLINAEAALIRGDTAGYLGFLNPLRLTPPSYILAGVQWTTAPTTPPNPLAPMAALTSPTSDTAAVSQLFNERARWLWATGHRLNDMRRLIRPTTVRGGYGRAENTVFPNGPYFKNGLIYGTDVNFPLPLDEQNNPGVQGCLDRLP